MKKNYFRFVAYAAIATSLVFAACNKDDDNNGDATEKIVPPKTDNEALALANAVYGPIQTLSSSYSFLLESATETTVSFEERDDSKDGPQVSILETVPSNWYPIKVFSRLYQSIGAANLAIDRISASELKDSVKNLLTARARFIRGYDYFQLVQIFGEVPLILSVDAGELDRTTRKSIDDIYASVVKDLTDAAAKLPQYDQKKSNPTQLAAKAILAKLYLTWGQKPLTQAEVEAIKSSKTDPAKPAPDNTKLQQALTYANEVINSNKYQLLPDFNNIWGVGNENNGEVIFSIHHDGDNIDAQGNHQTHCGYTWPKDERADPHISFADISYENAIADGDARKLYSYVTSVEFKDGNIDTLTWPLSIVRPGKWIHRSAEGTNLALDNQPNNIDHIDFRLGEIYLIKAEAQWFLNDGDKGLAALNTLRKRAGVDELQSVSVNSLYDEWANELAFEQKHWLNLVRWRTLILSILTKVPAYEYYKAAYNNADQFKALPGAIANRFAFYKRIYKHLHAKVDNIDGHFYRFPIPLGEKSNDLGIRPQNPGY
ncbi:MAG: RagB/SusD family nutrient uptake outer membrane protein [Prevotellaceae bacterium]|jgi:hypothetical protein|nr:RagB/SusD family nutrient uptake outer membrane protein [Prevotellaceae bacterium]